MKDIYDGNVITDANGDAVVQLPDWFEALNRDFRYQLTTIGQPAQAWIASKIANHAFTIKTDKPSVEISWQVTGIRQDAWANAHRIPVEAPKSANEAGHYLHPEFFGAPEEAGIEWARHPETMKRMKEMRAKQSSRHAATAGNPVPPCWQRDRQRGRTVRGRGSPARTQLIVHASEPKPQEKEKT